MPILVREFADVPADLFTREEPWSVAYVRSRQEKTLARYVAHYAVPFYLPQVEKRSRRAGRNFVSHLPLFPGYVFLRGGKEEQLVALKSGVVVHLIDVPDQGQLNDELSQLHQLQLSGAALIPHPYLTIGDAVRVTDGVFQGYHGIILREKGRSRLVVSVTMLRKSVAIELEREVLAPAPHVATTARAIA